MVRILKQLFFLGLIAASIASCGINSEVMFKPPKDYPFSQLPIDTVNAEYTIRPYDLISFAVYTNEGAVILEYNTGPAEIRNAQLSQFMDLTVNSEGEVEFPVIGNVKIDGLTVRQAEEKVEDIFETMFNRPYVILSVKSRQVVVFTSPEGSGQIVKLGEQYVSLVDALALAGGVGAYARASKIMLFRKVNGQTVSYMIDMSKIEGIKYASAPVESGDVIYVQARPRVTQKIAAEIRPLLILFTGASVTLSILSIFK